jgi:cytidylate kinase
MVPPRAVPPRKCVVIAGLPGCGKTTAAKYLARTYSGRSVSAGDVFRRLASEVGLPTSRAVLQELGNRFLQQSGPVALADQLINEVGGTTRAVIEGIRPVETVVHLKKSVLDVLVIFIDSDLSVRCERLLRTRGIPVEDCHALMTVPLELSVLDIRSVADVVIENNASTEALFGALREAVEGFW